ncbi:hypothetical protein [Streptomyces sp. DH12]|uniref:hypothetical protein n=1 Tax=Streptomyces sp. DH12 TaxID=2857010 RepID=UPI001E5B3ABC|nr:hypothetical protein [Streptomyces sp. DH12]
MVADFDISSLKVQVRGRPVISASAELVHGHFHDLADLADSIREGFGSKGDWCEVGPDLHTVTWGDAEIRLRPAEGLAAWRADYFQAGWLGRFDKVPEERRVDVARYVDRAADLTEGLLQASDLRAAAASGGLPAADRLVRRHVQLIDERYAALDHLVSDLLTDEGRLPAWALDVVHCQADDLNMAREWLGSAVVEFHHGTAGQRPVTIFGGVQFEFTNFLLNLVPTQGMGSCSHQDCAADAEATEREVLAPVGGR